MISNQFDDQVIEVTKGKSIVWVQGMIVVTGTGFDQLNAPYDAKVVGDYAGLTRPRCSRSPVRNESIAKRTQQKIRASLNTPCRHGGHSITPEERTYVDTEHFECPRFIPSKPEQSAVQS